MKDDYIEFRVSEVDGMEEVRYYPTEHTFEFYHSGLSEWHGFGLRFDFYYKLERSPEFKIAIRKMKLEKYCER